MKRLLDIQTELKCNKSQYNKYGGYNYRSCEDIFQAVKPLLEKYNVALTLTDDIISTDGGRFYVCATATLTDAETGLDIRAVRAFAREAESKKGMDEAQVTGSASSYARKYALNGLFLLDDVKDADTDEYTEAENDPPKPKGRSARVKANTAAASKDEPEAASADAPATPTCADIKEIQAIEALIKKTGKDESAICTYYKVEKLQDLTHEKAMEAYKFLKQYEAKLDGSR